MKRHISTSTGLVILALVLFAAGVAVWSYIPRDIQTPVQQDTSEDEVREVKNEPEPIGSITYEGFGDLKFRNKEFGFSLDFPASWSGYKTSIFRRDADDPAVRNGGYEKYVCFYFEGVGMQPYCLLMLTFFPAGGAAIEGEYFIHTFSNGSFIIGEEASCGEGNDFQCDRINEIPQILSSFKPL